MIHYSTDTGNFAIGSAAIYKDGKDGKMEMLNPKAANDPQPSADEVDNDVARWGSGNTLPLDMRDDIESTGVLFGGIDAKTRIALGKGPVPALVKGRTADGQEELEFLVDSEIDEWIEMNNLFGYTFDIMRDLWGFGNAWTKLLLNPNRTRLDLISRVDTVKCRFSAIDAKGSIPYTYISSDWRSFTSVESEHVQKIPLLHRKFPLQDLMNRKSGNIFMLSQQYTLQGRDYYAFSPWYPALKWVKIAQGVPEMKAAAFKNQLSIKYIVTIHPEYWKILVDGWDNLPDEKKKEQKLEFYKKMEETLSGGDNAFKSIWSTKVHDNHTNTLVSAVEIEAVDDKIKDGKLLPDSNAADIEILLPLMINPTIFGVDFGGSDAYGGGAGSGSNIREAYLVQLMLVEHERRIASKPFDIAKHVNGWAKRYKGSQLVLRYPNQILTTLNTGANTKNIA